MLLLYAILDVQVLTWFTVKRRLRWKSCQENENALSVPAVFLESSRTAPLADFLQAFCGRPALVKLVSGHRYQGSIVCLDGYMNIVMEQAEEYINGQLRKKYDTVSNRLTIEDELLAQRFIQTFSKPLEERPKTALLGALSSFSQAIPDKVHEGLQESRSLPEGPIELAIPISEVETEPLRCNIPIYTEVDDRNPFLLPLFFVQIKKNQTCTSQLKLTKKYVAIFDL